MSDNALFDNLPTSEASLIDNIISTTFIVDFGTVTAVQVNTINGQPVTVVSVQHAIELNKRGTILPPTVTPGIEVLWPSSAGLSERGSIAIGDTVLLVGFKDFVVSVANPGPAPASNQLHYCQETLRAIPLGTFKPGSTHTIDGSGSSLVIDGGTQGAARVNDATISNATTDAAFWSAFAAICAYCGVASPPTSQTGKVNAGSSKVQVG